MELTIQIYGEKGWCDAARLRLNEGGKRSARLAYEFDYALEHLHQTQGWHACALRYPIELMIPHDGGWFRFLDDIMPAGSARRYWVRQLDIGHLGEEGQDRTLLALGTIAPIGNLRIKEAVERVATQIPEQSRVTQLRFPVAMVLERDTDFLEYAQQMGAASGGATGAGGEAPKLLLRQNRNQEVWIDTFQDDPYCLDDFYLVKFPRNNRSAIDQDILRAEYHYYQELNALGIDTIPIHGMRLDEGSKYPSLWLPRFDVAVQEQKLVRFGVESVYSVMDAAPGSDLNHLDILDTLLPMLEGEARQRNTRFNSAAFVIEWVRRDLLNVVFGNSDNHGRNTALLKSYEGIWLAPVYDFAPMKADPEGIRRTTQWGLGLEEGGQFDWVAIAQRLSHRVEPDILLASLTELALRLKGLPERLARRGVPVSILNMPTFNFNTLDERLTVWIEQWGA